MELETLLVDASQAAKILGISTSSWYRLIAYKGAPTKLRVCRMARWRRQEVVDWVAAGMPVAKVWVWVSGTSNRTSHSERNND